jgi:hypothetical protein
MTLNQLKKELENARLKLVQLWDEKLNMTDPEVLKAAEDFDNLLNEFRAKTKARFI